MNTRAVAALGVVVAAASAFYALVLPQTPARLHRASAELIGDLGLWRAATHLPVPERPTLIALLVAAIVVAWLAAISLGVILTWRREASRSRLALVLAPAVVACTVGAFSLPTSSTDIFDYIAFGRVAAVYGENPYDVPPSVFPDDPLYHYASRAHRDNPDNKLPAWMLLDRGLAEIGGDDPVTNLLLYRLTLLVLTLGALALVVAIARRVVPQAALTAAVVFGWNPVVAVYGSSKTDAAMVFFFVLGVFAIVAGRARLAAVPLALSVWVKLITLPLVLLEWVRELTARRWRVAAVQALVFVAVTAVVYVPFGGLDLLKEHVGLFGGGRGSDAPPAATPATLVLAPLFFLVLGAMALVFRRDRSHLRLFRAMAVVALTFGVMLANPTSSWYLMTLAAAVAIAADLRLVAPAFAITFGAFLLTSWQNATSGAYPLPAWTEPPRISAYLVPLAVLGAAVAFVQARRGEWSWPAVRTIPGGALALLVVVCAGAAGPGAHATRAAEQPVQRALPPGFANEIVASGLELPTGLAFLPDGRILVAEKSGVVRLVKDGAVARTPFLDLRDRVNSFYERGLLGITVDPDYARNGFVYLLYTYEDDAARAEGTKTARLARYTARGDSAAPATERVLLGRRVGRSCAQFPRGADCIPNDFKGHAVGDLEFARDGTLFVGLGDASSWLAATRNSLRSQDLDSLAGKILRITREGKGLRTNPFWNGDPGAARSKVWSYGHRNPFRFALSPLSGLPYVGDVGWETFEEIDVARSGANYGWPCYESRTRELRFGQYAVCQALYAEGPAAVRGPLAAWRHSKALRGSVTGGSFNTGSRFPASYDGAYFYGDYVRGRIGYVQVDRHDRVVSGPWAFAADVRGPVDIRFGPDGALYYVSVVAGELRRIRYTGASEARPLGLPTVASAGVNPHSVAPADVDGDGALDLVAANAGSDDVAVLLAAEDGYAPARRHATGARPKVALPVDLDDDGDVDVVTANQDGSSVSVLLGTGAGRLGRSVDYETCTHAHDVAAGDVNSDGAVDLAVACFGGTAVSVLLGNGDGTFQAAVDHQSGESPHGIVVTDLNGDRHLDLAVANRGDDNVGVLLGRGDGTFARVERYPVGSRPHAIESADLDGDGDLDLVTANDRSDDVSVLLGKGDGTFARAASYAAGSVPKGIAVGDVTGDGRPDVVTANTGGHYDHDGRSPAGNTISVLPGRGSGTLAAAIAFVAGRTPFSVTIADLNRDGLDDVATANWHGGTVSVIPGRRGR